MRIKYSYYSLRFPSDVALLCLQFQRTFNATYVDLPFLLPIESGLCEYRETDIITFEGREYYVANKMMDVCFKSKGRLKEHYFGVINVTNSVPEYVLWAAFFDDKVERLVAEFKGSTNVRIYTNPARISATLKCDYDDV